jgi:hypothetical protein
MNKEIKNKKDKGLSDSELVAKYEVGTPVDFGVIISTTFKNPKMPSSKKTKKAE